MEFIQWHHQGFGFSRGTFDPSTYNDPFICWQAQCGAGAGTLWQQVRRHQRPQVPILARLEPTCATMRDG